MNVKHELVEWTLLNISYIMQLLCWKWIYHFKFVLSFERKRAAGITLKETCCCQTIPEVAVSSDVCRSQSKFSLVEC